MDNANPSGPEFESRPETDYVRKARRTGKLSGQTLMWDTCAAGLAKGCGVKCVASLTLNRVRIVQCASIASTTPHPAYTSRLVVDSCIVLEKPRLVKRGYPSGSSTRAYRVEPFGPFWEVMAHTLRMDERSVSVSLSILS